MSYALKSHNVSLARELSWLQRCPVHQKVVGLIPCQGTYLGYGFDPRSEHVREATNQCFSNMHVSLSLSFPLSLKCNLKNVLG